MRYITGKSGSEWIDEMLRAHSIRHISHVSMLLAVSFIVLLHSMPCHHWITWPKQYPWHSDCTRALPNASRERKCRCRRSFGKVPHIKSLYSRGQIVYLLFGARNKQQQKFEFPLSENTPTAPWLPLVIVHILANSWADGLGSMSKVVLQDIYSYISAPSIKRICAVEGQKRSHDFIVLFLEISLADDLEDIGRAGQFKDRRMGVEKPVYPHQISLAGDIASPTLPGLTCIVKPRGLTGDSCNK